MDPTRGPDEKKHHPERFSENNSPSSLTNGWKKGRGKPLRRGNFSAFRPKLAALSVFYFVNK
jgi:hypothetical protein